MQSLFVRWYLVLLMVVVFASGCGDGSIKTLAETGGEPASTTNEQPYTGPSTSVSPSSGTLNIQGTINLSSAYVNDADTNDEKETSVSNNTFATAQAIERLAVINGYVNLAGSGPTGKSSGIGDASDFFKANLKKGETIVLQVLDTDSDLDLVLYDASQNRYSSSATNFDVERMRVSADGEYYIEVVASSGASNYILTITDVDAFASDTEIEILPGEVLVKRNYGSTSQSTSGSDKNAMPERVVLWQDDAAEAQALGLGGRANAEAVNKEEEVWRTWRAVKKFNAQNDVEYAEPNFVYKRSSVPADPGYAQQQWHYELISLPAAWDAATGAGVEIAVIDDGILASHEDLAANLLSGGYDFVSSQKLEDDAEPGIDANPAFEGANNQSHGAHVAGTIAAALNDKGGVGVAYGAKLLSIKALNKDGVGSVYDLAQAVLYAAGLENDSTIIRPRVDIINMSLGGYPPSETLLRAIRQAREAGVIIVAAAGNDSSVIPSYPAAFEGVIAVSAVDPDSKLASYSNFGNWVDVAAPGGDLIKLGATKDKCIYSSSGGDSGYQGCSDGVTWVGTSMAAPHVSGVIALAESVFKADGKDLTPDLLDRYLNANTALMTTDIGVAGRDEKYGNGLINAEKAVQMIANTPPPLGKLIFSDAYLDYAYTINELFIQAIPQGGITVNDVVTVDEWLSIERLDAEFVKITVDRKHPSFEQDNTGAIIWQTDQGNYSVPVHASLFDFNGDSKANVGNVFVSLLNIDSNGDSSCVTSISTNSEEAYQFQFTEVEPGTLMLYATTDHNNDGEVCDIGEVCGAYQVPDGTSSLELNEDINLGINAQTVLDNSQLNLYAKCPVSN